MGTTWEPHGNRREPQKKTQARSSVGRFRGTLKVPFANFTSEETRNKKNYTSFKTENRKGTDDFQKGTLGKILVVPLGIVCLWFGLAYTPFQPHEYRPKRLLRRFPKESETSKKRAVESQLAI